MAHRKEDHIKKVLLKVAEDSAGTLLPLSVGTTSKTLSQLMDSVGLETNGILEGRAVPHFHDIVL
jgi:hypothetical protein